MKRKALVMGIILAIAVMTACGKKAASADASASDNTTSVSTETSADSKGDTTGTSEESKEELKKSRTKYDASGALVYKIDYDETGHPTYEYDNETGNAIEYKYELKVEDGNDVLYKYDAEGNLVTKWVYYGHSLKVHVETGYYNGNMIYETTYLENGQVAGKKDYNGELSNSEYDNQGKLIKQVEAGSGYDTYEYDADGKLIGQKGYDEEDNLIYTVTNEYDKKGNISKESEVYTDGSSNTTTSYSYDKNGYVSEVVTDYGDGYMDKDVFVRDKAGREIEYKYVYVENGEETEIQKITREYDDHGNPVTENHYTMGQKGPEVKYVYTYDGEGRILKKETYVDGELTDVENFEY